MLKKARSVFQDLMFRASSQEDLKKPNKIQLLGPSSGYRSKKVAFMLRCGCKNKDLAVGSKSGCMSQYLANLQQQQSRFDCRSHVVAAGAICGCRSKDLAAGQTLEKQFLGHLQRFYIFSDSQSFITALLGVIFARSLFQFC